MKKLITANDIRKAHAAGERRFEIVLKESIVTPEAHVVAEQLGFVICEVEAASCAVAAADPIVTDPGAVISAAERQKIRECIIAQIPENEVTETLIGQLTDKVVQERIALIKAKVAAFNSQGESGEASPANTQSYCSVTGKGGIKVVDSRSVKFGRFDGAGSHHVGIADLITEQDNSSMAAGFMQWENAFFPWTLNYDEVDLVLEGELHVRHEGETMIAKAGDVMFIPKGSAIEFGTPSTVRFLYVAWPANWQEC